MNIVKLAKYFEEKLRKHAIDLTQTPDALKVDAKGFKELVRVHSDIINAWHTVLPLIGKARNPWAIGTMARDLVLNVLRSKNVRNFISARTKDPNEASKFLVYLIFDPVEGFKKGGTLLNYEEKQLYDDIFSSPEVKEQFIEELEDYAKDIAFEPEFETKRQDYSTEEELAEAESYYGIE